MNLPGLPPTIEVGGKRWERHPDPHVSLFDSRRIKRLLPEGDHDELMKQMVKTVTDSPVEVTGVGPPWRVAEKADRRTLVIGADVKGMKTLYEKLSEQAGVAIPTPPTHVTVYTAPGKKGIGLGMPEEWSKLTRQPTPKERVSLPEPHELQEAFEEGLHPRDRSGKWMAKLGLAHLREVGGAPRDELLGKVPKDIDYVAAESPEHIQKAVEQAGGVAMPLMVRDRLVGVRAVHPDLPDGGVEIVPPRVEASTGAGRHDFEIVPHPGLDGSATPPQMLADDAQRRDFTINAIYRDPDTGELTDPTGHGEQDARTKVLRMVHDQSFQEDPLRMLRGARFASQHDLTPEPTTFAAMQRDSPGMTALTKKGVSGTVQDEMRKLLMGDNPGKGLRLMRDTGMLQSLLPELAPMVGFDQRSVYHEHTVDEHTFQVIDELARSGASYETRLAALFHDSGKPLTANPKAKDPEHFHFHSHPVHGNHQDVGADIARQTLNRLNYPRETINHVSDLVSEHMVTAVDKPTPVKARRLRARFSDRFLGDLLDHKAADMEGHGVHVAKSLEGVAKLRELLADNKDAPRTLADLKIDGNDLIKQGVKPGPQLGQILKQLLSETVDNPDLNRREWLLGRAEKLAATPVEEWGETDEPELEEASIYTEVLHPRDRLGRWLRKNYGVEHVGEDYPSMVRAAVRLRYPQGTDAEHEEMAKVVLGEKKAKKGMSLSTAQTKGGGKAAARGEAEDVVAELRRVTAGWEPDPKQPGEQRPKGGLRARWLAKLNSIATEAHADQLDKSGRPYIEHVHAVADSVSDEARPVALFHDALEDTELTPDALKQALIEPKVTTPEQAQTIVDAVGLLSREKSVPYNQYIESLANEPGKAGELAREVKRADLQHNLGRMTPEIVARSPNLKPRYEAALKTLAPERAPITQRGEPLNVNDLDEQVVMDRLEKLYEASEQAGTAEIEKHWYQQAHDEIWALAGQNDIDPHAFAAMVAATSPQMTWRHEFKDGRVKYPNLELALHAAKLARKYPDEPAPHLVDRLVEASKRRTEEERKAGPSELGGLGESILKSIRIYRGEDPERVLGAPKTRSFANNLTYPDRETTVTADEHMARAILGKGKTNYSKSTEGILREMADGSGYTWAADMIKKVAEKHGVLPHQAQAIIWVSQKKIADEMEAAAKAAKA